MPQPSGLEHGGVGALPRCRLLQGWTNTTNEHMVLQDTGQAARGGQLGHLQQVHIEESVTTRILSIEFNRHENEQDQGFDSAPHRLSGTWALAARAG